MQLNRTRTAGGGNDTESAQQAVVAMRNVDRGVLQDGEVSRVVRDLGVTPRDRNVQMEDIVRGYQRKVDVLSGLLAQHTRAASGPINELIGDMLLGSPHARMSIRLGSGAFSRVDEVQKDIAFLELLRLRVCVRCGSSFSDMRNVSFFGCSYHPQGVEGPARTHACCAAKSGAAGCAVGRHTDK